MIAGRQHASSNPTAAVASSSASPSSRARSGRGAVGVDRVARTGRRASRRCRARAASRRRAADPSCRARAPPRNGPRPRRRPASRMASRPASSAYSIARSGPSIGAAAAKWYARSATRGRPPRVALERLADAQVQLGAPEPRHAVVERPAHELVREPERELARRDLLDHPVRDRLLQRAGPARPDDREVELVAGDGGELEQVDGRVSRRARRWPTTSRTPSGLRRSASVPAGQPLSQRDSDSTQRAPQLGHEERVAAGQLAQRRGRPRPAPARGAPSAARSTNSAISSALSPARRTRTTPSSGAGRRARPTASPGPRPRCRGTW